MDSIKSIIGGVAVTLLIGGTAYTVNTADVVQNFAEDTGFTQEQAEQYINNIPDDELVSWDKIGADYLIASEDTLSVINDIDCEVYTYEWESKTLSCPEGRRQLVEMARDEVALGQSFIVLGSDSGSEEDIQETIKLLDVVNDDYDSEIGVFLYDPDVMDVIITTNLYNKALLQAALDGG
jgi:hypothetical protein